MGDPPQRRERRASWNFGQARLFFTASSFWFIVRAGANGMISSSIETRESWRVASVSLLTMACSFGAPWIAVVALKTIAADLNGARSTPALAGSLAWFGVGFGGIVMGRIADRIGVRWTVMFGAVMIWVGLAISSFGAPWQLYVGHGLLPSIDGYDPLEDRRPYRASKVGSA